MKHIDDMKKEIINAIDATQTTDVRKSITRLQVAGYGIAVSGPLVDVILYFTEEDFDRLL